MVTDWDFKNAETHFADTRRYLGAKFKAPAVQLHYRPAVRLFVNAIFPAKRLIAHAPAASIVRSLRTLLAQEEIRRSFS